MRHFGMQGGGGIGRGSSLPTLPRERRKNEGGERRVQASAHASADIGRPVVRVGVGHAMNFELDRDLGLLFDLGFGGGDHLRSNLHWAWISLVVLR